MLAIIIGLLLGALIYYKLLKPASFWADKNIPYEPSWPLVGNYGPFLLRKKHFYEIGLDIYNKYPDKRYVGYVQFTTPSLMVRDLDLIKQIGIKDFENFHDHNSQKDFDDLLFKSLINLNGNDWKQMRATLSPAFTSAKMKAMYHLMTQCAQSFAKHFQKPTEVEMKDMASKFANNVIATIAFGIQVDAVKDPEQAFYVMGKKIIKISLGQFAKMLIIQTAPKLCKMLGIQALSSDLRSFFRSTIMDNIDRRKRDKIVRPDLIHLLLEAQRGQLKHDSSETVEGFATVEESHVGKSANQMQLTDDHIVAQALLFFFAGFDTVSNAASIMAYELGVHPDVQKKLQQEIDAVIQKHGQDVPYEAILSMKYLDQVVCESLRIWPPAFHTDRLCNQDYPIKALRTSEIDFTVPKGVLAIIPIMAIHKDPTYFPEPDRFDPERFSDENKANIVPGSYMPFGLGPRNCIGSRLALLETKTLLFHLLSKVDIVPNEKTVIPLRPSPKNLNLAPENGFQLTFKPREDSKMIFCAE